MTETLEVRYPWYDLVAGDTPLEQGDFLNNFPTPVSRLEDIPATLSEGQKIQGKFDLRTYNMVVITQSCDFQDIGNEDQVILCPRYNYLKLFEVHKEWNQNDIWKKLIKGLILNSHLLNKCVIVANIFDYQVVSLNEIYSLPYGFVKKEALKLENRIRLLPPYREHLAQAFARQFMRVGIPPDSDLPKENPYKQVIPVLQEK
jgi:hypothetical protein